jgi:hypothetical protein
VTTAAVTATAATTPNVVIATVIIAAVVAEKVRWVRVSDEAPAPTTPVYLSLDPSLLQHGSVYADHQGWRPHVVLSATKTGDGG